MCPYCGGPDKTDLSAESRGLLYKARAAEMAGRSRTWIEDRISAKQLETRSHGGRSYVVADSLRRLLLTEGGPSLVDRADVLEERGERFEAMQLRQEAQARANAQDMARGIGYAPMPSEDAAIVKPDWIGQVVNRSRGGR